MIRRSYRLPRRGPAPEVMRIVMLWAAWLVIVCAFQAIVQARVTPARPDNVLAWTGDFTWSSIAASDGSACRPRLADPMLNEHVSFDSEYYISIAVAGYDDPLSNAYVWSGYNVSAQGVPACNPPMIGHYNSLNAGFMPGYPMAMKGVMAIEGVIPGLSSASDDGRATVAGIVVSALGGLLAMFALARLMAEIESRRRRKAGGTAEEIEAVGPWGGVDGFRAALFLLVFPTGFYLAQVYTEGLFLGLSFMCCAMALEKRLLPATLLAIAAALTRQVGVFLFFPLAFSAYEVLKDQESRSEELSLRLPAFAVLAPLVTFVVWYTSALGRAWWMVESEYFGRSYDPLASLSMWFNALQSVVSGRDRSGIPWPYTPWGGGQLASSTAVYLSLELGALALGLIACVWLWRRGLRGVAVFGFAVLLLSGGSSSVQSMERYVLAVPAIFLMLAWLGRNPVFDRVWTMASTLLMGMLVTLFTFGYWVA